MISEQHTDADDNTNEESNPSGTARGNNDSDRQQEHSGSHVDVTPRTIVLAAEAFQNHESLVTINLPVGLQQILENAFLGCASLQSIDIPPTVHCIRDRAFYKSGLTKVDLAEGLRVLGQYAFACTPLRLARMPVSLKFMAGGTFYRCFRMISVELPASIFLADQTFLYCYSLRNIALKDDCSVGNQGLARCTYLATHFPNEDDRVQALQRRFDGLPVHQLCYYHSYYGSATNTERFVSLLEEALESSSDTINDHQSPQDCLGMTPVHILALSTRQILPLYQVVLTYSPKDVVIKDKWGDLPLHFACKVDAPLEIIELLLEESYKAMDENIDLEIEGLLKDSNNHFAAATARMLLQYHIRERIESLALEAWRQEVLLEIDQVAQEDNWSERDDRITGVLRKIQAFESMESTSLLELAFWKSSMESSGCRVGEDRFDSSIRQHYRIHCGVGIAVPNVLQFLQEDDDESTEEMM